MKLVFTFARLPASQKIKAPLRQNAFFHLALQVVHPPPGSQVLTALVNEGLIWGRTRNASGIRAIDSAVNTVFRLSAVRVLN